METGVKELTEKYRKRFEAFIIRKEAIPTERKREEENGESPSFLKEVIRPILDTLPELLPRYGLIKTTGDYAMYGKYCRIKAGAVLIGGFSISENLGYFLHLCSMVRPVVKAIG